MHIDAEAHVIGQIPADVVRILVDDDFIRVPEPAVAESYVGSRDIPVPSIEPEPAGSAACEPPNVPGAKAAGKVTVRPRIVEMVARIVGAGIVTNPGISIHVRSIGVARLVAVVALRAGRLGRAMYRRSGRGPAVSDVGSAAGPDAGQTPARRTRAKLRMRSEWTSSIPPDARQEKAPCSLKFPGAGHQQQLITLGIFAHASAIRHINFRQLDFAANGGFGCETTYAALCAKFSSMR